MFNILSEHVIRVYTADGLHETSLPQVYAALVADEVEAFPCLAASSSAMHCTLSWCSWEPWRCTGPTSPSRR